MQAFPFLSMYSGSDVMWSGSTAGYNTRLPRSTSCRTNNRTPLFISKRTSDETNAGAKTSGRHKLPPAPLALSPINHPLLTWATFAPLVPHTSRHVSWIKPSLSKSSWLSHFTRYEPLYRETKHLYKYLYPRMCRTFIQAQVVYCPTPLVIILVSTDKDIVWNH